MVTNHFLELLIQVMSFLLYFDRSVHLQNAMKDFFWSQSATSAQEWTSSSGNYCKITYGTLVGTLNMLKGPLDAKMHFKSDS